MRPPSIVTVTWNCAGDLARLVGSLREHLEGPLPELVVIDNDSADDPEAALASWPGPSVFEKQHENRGFGIANNRGVELASGDVILLLNPDTEVIDSSISVLFERAGSPGKLVGPRVLNTDRTIQPSASGPEVGLWPWVRAFLPGAATPPPIRTYTEPYRSQKAVRAAWLTGCAVAGAKRTLQHLGPFDPRIHLYGEDLELGLRAGDLGVVSMFEPGARLIHHGKSSSSQIFSTGLERVMHGEQTRQRVLRERYGAERERRATRALELNLTLRGWSKRILGRGGSDLLYARALRDQRRGSAR